MKVVISEERPGLKGKPSGLLSPVLLSEKSLHHFYTPKETRNDRLQMIVLKPRPE